MLISILARFLGALTSLYMILCAIRVFMSWAPGLQLGKLEYYMARIVDPYLSLFSRMTLFRTRQFDFSPIIALAVLSVANNLFSTLALTGRLSLGFVASLILGAAWSAVSFVLSFLIACILIRIAVYLLKLNSVHPVWMVVDSIINPVLFQINRLIYRGKAVDYLQGLITGFLVLLLCRAGLGALIRIVSGLLLALPF